MNAQYSQLQIMNIIINQKVMNKTLLTLCLLIVLVLSSDSEKSEIDCQNNGKIENSSGMCICSPGYIGNLCQFPAYSLNQQSTLINFTKNFTLAYYKPEQRYVYRIILSFCTPESFTQKVDIKIFAEEQTLDSTFTKQPMDSKKIVQFELSDSKRCQDLMSALLFSIRKKQNGEIPKIIFGFKLSETSEITSLVIDTKCSTQSIFPINFIMNSMIGIFILVVMSMCASAILTFKKRLIQRRRAQQQERKFLETISQLMPSKKYETLIQQIGEEALEKAQHCSICLCDFQKNQNIRQTPCGHLFHENCIDSWCKTNLNCPICRSQFSGESPRRQVIEIQLQLQLEEQRPDRQDLQYSIHIENIEEFNEDIQDNPKIRDPML